jgi:hypothetical protein
VKHHNWTDRRTGRAIPPPIGKRIVKPKLVPEPGLRDLRTCFRCSAQAQALVEVETSSGRTTFPFCKTHLDTYRLEQKEQGREVKITLFSRLPKL